MNNVTTDAAQIQQIQAITIRQLADAGYDRDLVVRAVMADDFALLIEGPNEAPEAKTMTEKATEPRTTERKSPRGRPISGW